ncbi:hypothetical protein B7486_19190 [cyanobacterium TDX16]|nr:hypothetical protein B7486_19190 [cyanobacterium TDX16]
MGSPRRNSIAPMGRLEVLRWVVECAAPTRGTILAGAHQTHQGISFIGLDDQHNSQDRPRVKRRRAGTGYRLSVVHEMWRLSVFSTACGGGG